MNEKMDAQRDLTAAQPHTEIDNESTSYETPKLHLLGRLSPMLLLGSPPGPPPWPTSTNLGGLGSALSKLIP